MTHMTEPKNIFWEKVGYGDIPEELEAWVFLESPVLDVLAWPGLT